MKKTTRTMLYGLALCLLLPWGQSQADYDIWNDDTYNFRGVSRIYAEELDTAPAQIESAMEAYRLKEDFVNKATAVKDLTIITKALPPPVQKAVLPETPSVSSAERHNIQSSNPAEGMEKTEVALQPDSPTVSEPSEITAKQLPVVIPQAARENKANLYVTAQVTAYHVGSGLIPAHTEWNYYTVQDVFYDRNGDPHWFSRRVGYPVYVPDTYVPMATVCVQFRVYDTETGKIVSVSEDRRTRGSSDDLRSVYNRIIDRFFKNLKKEIQK